MYISCSWRPCHHGQKSKALQPCRGFVRASSPHQDQPLNSVVFLRARPFAFSLGSSKDQGLGNWLQVHHSISGIELEVASNLRNIATIATIVTLCHPMSSYVNLLINKGMSCQISRLSPVPLDNFFCDSGPIFAVAPTVHQACLAAMFQNDCSLLQAFVILTYIIHWYIVKYVSNIHVYVIVCVHYILHVFMICATTCM